MSAIRRVLTATTLCVLLPALGLGTLAGVSARSEGNGKRVGARADAEIRGSHVLVWGGGRIGGALLNPRGDANGDLWPTIVESSVAPHYPWVVWSRFNGTNYDLAWSRWQGTAWGSIQWILPEHTPGDDLDADLTFDHKGTPYVAWWRQSEEGVGEVYLSINLGRKWSRGFLVSRAGLDSRHPLIDVYGSGKIVITYSTPQGLAQQAVIFARPDTITDDINPLTLLRLDGEPVFISSQR